MRLYFFHEFYWNIKLLSPSQALQFLCLTDEFMTSSDISLLCDFIKTPHSLPECLSMCLSVCVSQILWETSKMVGFGWNSSLVYFLCLLYHCIYHFITVHCLEIFYRLKSKFIEVIVDIEWLHIREMENTVLREVTLKMVVEIVSVWALWFHKY